VPKGRFVAVSVRTSGATHRRQSLHHRHWLSVPDRLLGVEMLSSSTRRPAVRPAPDRMTAIGGGSEVEVPAGNRRGQTGKQPFTPFITRVYGLVSLEGLKDPLE
jgi:hypothetical protein